jgi:hypothetical protein
MTAEAKPMTPADMVSHYIRLRDYKKAADEEYKKSMERVNQAMDKLESQLLAHLQETGAQSLACAQGTVYRNTQYSASVESRDTFMEWVLADPERLEALDVKANKTFVKDMANEKGEVPPGVKFTQMHTVGVRRS